MPQAITETQVLKKLQRDGKLLPPTEMRLGKKEGKKESTDGHLLKEAIVEYREEMKTGDEKTWAREDSGLVRWHYFISHAVMAQPWIDYMTIAIWVSHRDKGILIAKKYGHLRPGHTARMSKHLDTAFEV